MVQYPNSIKNRRWFRRTISSQNRLRRKGACRLRRAEDTKNIEGLSVVYVQAVCSVLADTERESVCVVARGGGGIQRGVHGVLLVARIN